MRVLQAAAWGRLFWMKRVHVAFCLSKKDESDSEDESELAEKLPSRLGLITVFPKVRLERVFLIQLEVLNFAGIQFLPPVGVSPFLWAYLCGLQQVAKPPERAKASATSGEHMARAWRESCGP